MNKRVSIIIPCRNEEKYISKCLDSIVHSDYDKKLLSVYVCDGMSTDKTIDIIKSYESNYPFIFYLPNEKQTTPFALNLGIKKSTSDIDIILGAHAAIETNYISECVKCFEIDSAIGCVGGMIENVYENESSEAIGKAMSSAFGVGNAHFRTGGKEGFVDTAAFGAYKKSVFEKIGYFDEDLIRNQDDEFNFRLTKSGFRIYLSKNIRSKYFVRSSFLKLFRQYYQYGYWKVFVNKKHHTITTLRQIVPSAFVLFCLTGGISFLFSAILGYLYLSVICFYFLSAFVFALKVNKSVSGVVPIVWSFMLLHFGYGIGYLEGILKFLILNNNPKKSSAAITR